ncbi:MAG: molybdopterin oxidoreductase family protein [Rhodospirillales bacterium]|nr:molybdopterin oxidoreductase family protein [Rhodospirillales bacterium]
MSRDIELSPHVSDQIKYTTCYMCACRCGIKVHLTNGEVRYIQGNPNHPINKGVLCAKGSAGIMQHNSPARLTKPLKRVGERGAGEFEEIEWEEAMEIATKWLGDVRSTAPEKLAFFTGRDQSQSLTGWWAKEFGTPNYAAHGGFCSVNMAAAGIYTIGSAFWEFSEPDWEHTKYFLMFGVAEDHDSNPIKRGLGELKGQGGKYISINPVRTGYAALADEWLGIKPGTDGLFVLALIHELLRAGKVDVEYLKRYSNAVNLVIQDGDEDGLFVRDEEGNELCWDVNLGKPVPSNGKDSSPALKGEFTLADGRIAKPVFHILAERYLEEKYSPDAVAEETGIDGATIKRIAAEMAHAAFEEELTLYIPWTDWCGRKHDKMVGRPVAMHAMRGISAHSNGFHTCRAIHVLQILLGSIDAPGGMRFKPPYPKGLDSMPKPTGMLKDIKPNTPLAGGHLGYVTAPEDLLVDDDGKPQRIDKAFSWDAPMSAHGLMHMVISNAWRGDPYPVDVLFLYMANMAWNSTMNTAETIKMLTDKDEETGEYKIPKIIYSDAYYSETVAFADLILPDTTYLERWDCISLLDRPICDADGPSDSIRQPVVKPNRDVRPFQDVIIELGARLGLPGLTNEGGEAKYPGGYSDYIINHERAPGVGLLAGWRGEDGDELGVGAPNKRQLEKYIANQCFWRMELAPEQRYFKTINKDYLEYAADMRFIGSAKPIIGQIYSEPMQKFRLAAQGKGEVQPPESHRKRVETYFDPLPIWYTPFENEQKGVEEFPMHALTQRPAAMYHSWGTQNAWLRQIHGSNNLHMSRKKAEKMGIENGDWVKVSSRNGEITVQVELMDGVNEDTVWTWNAIGKRSGAWNLEPDAKEAQEGFLLNHLIDERLPADEHGYAQSCSDPVTGQGAWFDVRVRVEKVNAKPNQRSEPVFETVKLPEGMQKRPDILRYGANFKKKGMSS